MATAAYEIRFDKRLDIDRPYLHVDYEELPEEIQHEFELRCQEICSKIPEKIKQFEEKYMEHFEALKEAENEEEFYHLTNQMNDLSKIICDLNLLFLHIEGTFISNSLHA